MRHDGQRALVIAAGELDLAAAPALRARLAPLIAAGIRDVVVDLHRVTFMDCAMLRVLLNADARLRASGGSLTVAHPPPQVERLLALTGMEGALPREAEVPVRG